MEERQRKGRKVWRKRKNKGGMKERSMRKRSEESWRKDGGRRGAGVKKRMDIKYKEEEEDRRRRRGS